MICTCMNMSCGERLHAFIVWVSILLLFGIELSDQGTVVSHLEATGLGIVASLLSNAFTENAEERSRYRVASVLAWITGCNLVLLNIRLFDPKRDTPEVLDILVVLLSGTATWLVYSGGRFLIDYSIGESLEDSLPKFLFTIGFGVVAVLVILVPCLFSRNCWVGRT